MRRDGDGIGAVGASGEGVKRRRGQMRRVRYGSQMRLGGKGADLVVRRIGGRFLVVLLTFHRADNDAGLGVGHPTCGEQGAHH